MPVLKKYMSVLFLMFLSLTMSGQEIDHWESILGWGSTCRYLVPDAPVDPGWTGREFDDTGWSTGPGGVGYGDEDDPTVIDPAISVYCRYHFEVTDPAVIGELILDVDFDDGFVAYLNGTELGRHYMSDPDTPTLWDQPADALHEARLYQGMDPFRVPLQGNAHELLITGDNVLAIEVHNENFGSSDLSSNIYLHAGILTPDTYFQGTPDWFYPPFQTDSTLLPLMIIDTEGQEIPNEPRITAHMGLIHRDYGRYNSTKYPFNEYNGQISIEMRGESTLWLYPKKSYSIETQTSTGENNNVSLLDMPVENDYVLYGPYGDKSLIRNVITYRLYEKMGHYSPRTRFMELVINGDYKGLYLLTEKIKRDRNRVDMARITPEDVTLSDMSGGYILRVDKTSAMEPQEYWESPYQPPVPGYNRVVYQYFDPDYYELTPNQRTYIQNHMLDVEQALVSQDFADPVNGYRAYFDIPSFIDLMILNEFSKDVDGFRLSHYFYKHKDTDGGKLVNGPPWDYNLTFGNSDYTADVHLTHEWTYTLTNTIYWWARVMEDEWFRNQLYCRWDELYSSVMSQEKITWMIDSSLIEMGEAISRNFQRWPVLGEYVWPNSFVAETHDQEMEYLRNWISDRLVWMDGRWGGLCIPTSSEPERVMERPGLIRAYPNPSDLSRTFVSINFPVPRQVMIHLYDLNGRRVYQGTADYAGEEYAFALPDLSFLPDGIYTLEVSDGMHRRERCKLVKQ